MIGLATAAMTLFGHLTARNVHAHWTRARCRRLSLGAILILAASHPGCAPRPGTPAYQRAGDEIMVCGQLFHTGAPVVLWTDPGGYDAYRVERRFAPLSQAGWTAPAPGPGDGRAGSGPEAPARYNTRFFRFAQTQPSFVGAAGLSEAEIARVRGGGWDLGTLQRVVDQFVIHYDVCGTSRQCFRILHDVRGLSVHFLLDVDGTIYQTLDLKERAWHATSSNDRSIGIEIANIGAYAEPALAEGEHPANSSVGATAADGSYRHVRLPPTLARWYLRDKAGWYLSLPAEFGDGGVRTRGFVARPARPAPVVGSIQGRALVQFDLTTEQYRSLARLTAALCRVFPNLPCECPRAPDGTVPTGQLPEDQLRAFRGILGHYHIQKDKTDPGPAFRWEMVIGEAKALLRPGDSGAMERR